VQSLGRFAKAFESSHAHEIINSTPYSESAKRSNSYDWVYCIYSKHLRQVRKLHGVLLYTTSIIIMYRRRALLPPRP